MCGKIRRTPYDGLPYGQERDMARMHGWGLRLMREQDAAEYLDELGEELDQLLDEQDPKLSAGAIAELIDLMDDIEAGRIHAPVPAYDPADERAVKVGHENPIRWVRETEARVKEMKRRRRIAC
jgi:hypothetical protein